MVATQFSLSLELGRLLPVTLITDKAAQYIMSLARDLQPKSSGSDIIVEQDLAEVFGLLTVVDAVASSFRTTMSMAPVSHSLTAGLDLMSGPGPTVARAMSKDQRPYFSTVLQCSFFVTGHETASLAAALAEYLNKRAEEVMPTQRPRAVPSIHSIRGMLQACEDQTSHYDWQAQLLATATLLELTEESIHEPLPPVILHGLLTSLPLVQHFPEDRYVIVKTPHATCTIVTWLYTILGIPVLVRFHGKNDSCREIKLPKDDTVTEQVLVDVREYKKQELPGEDLVQRSPGVLLLSTDTHEKLFRWKASPDDEGIDATFKRPAKGLGRKILENQTPHLPNREKVIEEMQLLACSFAIRIARKLRMSWGMSKYDDNWRDISGYQYYLIETNSSSSSGSSESFPGPTPYEVDEGRVMQAFGFLFDCRARKSDRKTIEDYVGLYDDKSFHDIESAPSCLEPIYCEWDRRNKGAEEAFAWPRLRKVVMQLATLILAFAHVLDLEACNAMPLCELINLLTRSSLWLVISAWNGKSCLSIREDVWLEIIALMMLGHTHDRLELNGTCVLSSRGWSVFISSFGDSDPYHIQPGTISIRQGIPWRHSIWKHRVVDGPRTLAYKGMWNKVGSSGDKAVLKCLIPVKRGSPLVGENGDSFIITLRLLHKSAAAPVLQTKESSKTLKNLDVVRRSGYHQLWSALWMVLKTLPCQHLCRLGDHITLEPGWTTLTGYGDYDSLKEHGPVKICLTAGNAAARWRTLLSIAERRGLRDEPVFLRGSDCCFKCAVVQAARESSKGCYVVL